MPLLIIVYFLAIPVLWLGLFFQSHRLFYTFRERYPEEAKAKIRHAFDSQRSPSKFFYFTASESAAFLEEKKDSVLLALRKQVIRLSIASVAVPFGGMAIVGILAVTGVLR